MQGSRPRGGSEPQPSSALATLFTVTLASHGATGRWTGLALPDDALHLSAVSLWFGGLLMLTAAVLPTASVDTLIETLPRYSNLAFCAVVAIFVTGTFQAIRQVGTIHALTSTTYGHLLLIKISAFTVLIIVAAFSREIVDRTYEPIREAAKTKRQLATVGRGASPAPDETTDRKPASRPFFDPADKTTIRRLATDRTDRGRHRRHRADHHRAPCRLPPRLPSR